MPWRCHIAANEFAYSSGIGHTWYAATMPASSMRLQYGSHAGSAGDRPPAGPGRITITFAPSLEDRVELGARELRIEHRDERRRVDAVVVVEAPVVVEPQVEGAEELVGHAHVVGVEPVDAHAERREEHRAFDALLVHRAQARVAVAVLVGQRFELPELLHRVHVAPVAVLGELLEPGVEGAGLADRVERRVRDRRGHDVAEDEAPLLAFGHPAHEALHLVVAVTGEGVLGLVVVVVEVDEPVVERGHGGPLSACVKVLKH